MRDSFYRPGREEKDFLRKEKKTKKKKKGRGRYGTKITICTVSGLDERDAYIRKKGSDDGALC